MSLYCNINEMVTLLSLTYLSKGEKCAFRDGLALFKMRCNFTKITDCIQLSLQKIWSDKCPFSKGLFSSLISIWWVSKVTQSYPNLWDPMNCSPPGSSVHGILQARILEWVAISFSRGSSRPRDWTQVSRLAGRCFTVWTERFRGRQMDTTYKGNFDGFT